MDISRIWMFEIETQDKTHGGFILADTEEDAKKKLYLEVNLKKDETVSVYPMTALDLNKSVHIMF